MSTAWTTAKGRDLTSFNGDLFRLEAALRVLHGYVHRIVGDDELPELFASDLAFQLDDARRLASALAGELFESGPCLGSSPDCSQLRGAEPLDLVPRHQERPNNGAEGCAA